MVLLHTWASLLVSGIKYRPLQQNLRSQSLQMTVLRLSCQLEGWGEKNGPALRNHSIGWFHPSRPHRDFLELQKRETSFPGSFREKKRSLFLDIQYKAIRDTAAFGLLDQVIGQPFHRSAQLMFFMF